MSGKEKKIDGKAFVADLDACYTSKDIFDLLSKTMDKETLTDRTKKASDNDLIIALHAQKAGVNTQLGCRTSHEDCVLMAAERYHTVTGKGIKFFKAEMNKYITAREKEDNAKVLMASVISARQAIR